MTSVPFKPLVITTPNHDDQRLDPALDDNGTPVWETGDGNISSYYASGLGACQGAMGNERVHPEIDAHIFVTDARVVVVCSNWAKGSKRGPAGFGGPIISSAIANKVSQARAARRASGQYLVGQMRHPWISRVAYSMRENRRTENTVRVIGSHKTAFGDVEPVILVLHLERHADPWPLAQDIARRAIADRIDFSRTTDEERSALQAAAWSAPESVEPGTIPAIRLAGSFIVSGSSAYLGTASSRSEPSPSARPTPTGTV